ncbi:DUF6623 family protein [Maribellus maritimus]|uniref:DUF6623 family protein n=1 Tax=Maribellus maritimus TaxID=2870838 RepID=UPI001EEA5306|nr:DUF6623 family protein [Maribellus maritimus]MCG6186554.1 hypothetical protein [Maribellus maritimus]
MGNSINRNITQKGKLSSRLVSPPQLKYAAWAHGVSAQVERPNFLIGHRLGVCTIDDGDAWLGILRQGDGAKFYGEKDTNNWFHIALHSPVILNGTRLKLSKIFVLFRCAVASHHEDPERWYGTKIHSVHVWDGANRIKTYDNLELSGEHKTIKENVNQFILEPAIPVYYGISISVGVSFFGKYISYNKIKFYAAGGDFV